MNTTDAKHRYFTRQFRTYCQTLDVSVSIVTNVRRRVPEGWLGFGDLNRPVIHEHIGWEEEVNGT
jgi:hypothetical protein